MNHKSSLESTNTSIVGSVPYVKQASSTSTDIDKSVSSESPALPAQFQGKEDAVAYSTRTGLWQFEDIDTGLNYEYNPGIKLWLPVADENAEWMLKSTYDDHFNDNKHVPRGENQKDNDKNHTEENSNIERERGIKNTGSCEENVVNAKKRIKLSKPAKTAEKKKRNTAVYVSNIPLDTTVEELNHVFSRFGVIAEDLITGEKRIKIYTDEHGQPKGDGLIIFFKPESVKLAIQMLDDTELRYGDGQRIQLQEATFKDKPEIKKYQGENDNDDRGSIETKPELSKKQKNKIKQKYQDLNHRLADWDDDDILVRRDQEAKKRWEKVVIIKHAFTLEELQLSNSEAFGIQQDILEGCQADIGPVTNVTLFDLEPEGVVSVKFKEKTDALKCVEVMNGRFFGGNQLEVMLYDGLIKYQKSKNTNSTLDEDDQEVAEQQRLEDYARWLENEKSTKDESLS